MFFLSPSLFHYFISFCFFFFHIEIILSLFFCLIYSPVFNYFHYLLFTLFLSYFLSLLYIIFLTSSILSFNVLFLLPFTLFPRLYLFLSSFPPKTLHHFTLFAYSLFVFILLIFLSSICFNLIFIVSCVSPSFVFPSVSSSCV